MRVVVEMLYAGQGMCNCITVYEGDNLVRLYLIDMGSTGHGRQEGSGTGDKWGPVHTDMVTVVDEYLEKKSGVLDLLVISHLDADHYNYISKLTELTSITRLVIGGTAIGTRNLDYGGLNRLYAATSSWGNGSLLRNFFNYLNGIAVGRVDILNEHSDYAGTNGEIASYHSPGGFLPTLRLRLLLSRCFWNDDDLDCDNHKAWYINGNSAMVVMEYYENYLLNTPPDFCMIFPGDAIHMTFNLLNSQISERKLQCGFLEPHCSWRGMVAAHHASYETNRGDEVSEFIEMYRPTVVTASACLRFKHPDERILNMYGEYTEEITDGHNNLVYGMLGGYRLVPCNERIYTNYWEFSVQRQRFIGTYRNNWTGQRVPWYQPYIEIQHRYRRIVVAFEAGAAVPDVYEIDYSI